MGGIDREEEEAFEELLHPTRTWEEPALEPESAEDDEWLLDAKEPTAVPEEVWYPGMEEEQNGNKE